MMSDENIAKYFQGVYPIDQILHRLRGHAMIMINLDTSKESGSHWVESEYKTEREGIQFDSLGSKLEKEIYTIYSVQI